MIFSNFILEHWCYLVVAIVGVWVAVKKGSSVTLAYFILNALFFGLRAPFQIMTYYGGFQAAALYTIPALILIPLVATKIAFLQPRTLERLLLIVGLSCYIPGLYIQPSFAYCIGMLCLGALVVVESKLAYLLFWALVPTLFFHGSTSKIMFALIYLGWGARYGKKMILPVTLFAAIAAYAMWKTTPGVPLLGGSERLLQWKQAMSYFYMGGDISTFRHLFGFGAGSYTLLGGAIQGFEGTFFSYLHNDILQVLFEYGLVGHAILHIFLAWMFVKCKGTKEMALMSACYVFMLFYFPLHFTVSAVMMGVCAVLILGRNDEVI